MGGGEVMALSFFNMFDRLSEKKFFIVLKSIGNTKIMLSKGQHFGSKM